MRSTLSSKHFRDLRRKGRKLESELGISLSSIAPVIPKRPMTSSLSRLRGGRARRERRWRLDRRCVFRAICGAFSEAAGCRWSRCRREINCGDAVRADRRGLPLLLQDRIRRVVRAILAGNAADGGNGSEFHRRPELEWVDSCSKPNSDSLERLWPDRRELTTVLVPKPAEGRRRVG